MNLKFRIVERTCCPVCNSNEIEKVLTHYDDRYGHPDFYDIFECRNSICQLAFLKQHIIDEDLYALYSNYYHHYKLRLLPKKLDYCKQFLKLIRDFIYNTDNLYSRLEYGQRVLDVGCGYGPSVSFLERKFIKWVGLEIDPKKVRINQNKGLDCKFGDLEDYAKVSKNVFDVILVNQVIEHVSSPVSFFQLIRKLIADNGKVYFSTPNYSSKYRLLHGRLWIHWHVPYHQLYFNIISFNHLAEKTGFKIEHIYTRTPFPFFVLQRNIKPCQRGEKNPSFHEKKSLKDLIYFRDLDNFTAKQRFDEDCLYAQICKI